MPRVTFTWARSLETINGPETYEKPRREPALSIQVDPGTTILEAMDRAGVKIHTPCGGTGRCGKCKVLISGKVNLPQPAEYDFLAPEEIASGLRLACQAQVLGDVSVAMPDASPTAGVQILTSIFTPTSHNMDGPEFNSADGQPSCSAGRQASHSAAARAPVAHDTGGLIEADTPLSAAKSGDIYGMAVDIGTTTLVVYLVELSTGKLVAVASAVNPQTRFGDDVISRISYAGGGKNHIENLRGAVLNGLNSLIDRTAGEAGISTDRIHKATLVGNTCMHHLFLGIDPSPLGVAPYHPVVKDAITLTGSESMLHMNKAGRAFLLPNIGGFVGADTVAVILASGLDRAGGVAVAIDLGTNGEIVLSARGRLLACSTAAGPAFEGWRITSGMRARTGAIDRVYFDGGTGAGPAGAFSSTVIGDTEPVGICGSGLADLMAGLLSRGIITESGRMLSPREATELLGNSPLCKRMRIGAGGPEFVVAGPGFMWGRAESVVDGTGAAAGKPGIAISAQQAAASPPELVFTQRDARELQLACAAIHTGLEILKEAAGVVDRDIESVFLAGGFGNYLAPESARILGLVPDVPLERIIPMGNGAGAGAVMALLSEAAAERAISIGRSVEHIELANSPRFAEVFMDSMVYRK